LDEIDIIRVGVVFRTDTMGKVHVEHDLAAVDAMNNLGLPFRIVGVTLPEGASGPVSPDRTLSGSELNGIDMLYIPGGPTANDTQVGDTLIEGDLNRPRDGIDPGDFNEAKPQPPNGRPTYNRKDPQGSRQRMEEYETSIEYRAYERRRDAWMERRQHHESRQKEYEEFQADPIKYNRILKEHTERAAYELSLISMAKSRGIPIMAVCAGSWRLLESYGGRVRTLSTTELPIHKAPNRGDTWTIGHGVEVEPHSMTGQSMGQGGTYDNVNTTHWAVADERHGLFRKHNPVGEDPNELIEVSGRTGDGIHDATGDHPRLNEKTVEAFESKFGAPIMGLQWHPEGYLPDMVGQYSGSPEIQEGSKGLFKFMAEAAHSSRVRRQLINREVTGKPYEEEKAYNLLKEVVKLFFEGSPVGAGNLYREVVSVLPRGDFSARMESLDDGLRFWREAQLAGSKEFMKAEGLRMKAAYEFLKHDISIFK